MNKEKYNQIIDEGYKNYFLIKSMEKGPFGISGLILPKEEFINNCKTNPEFSEKWGLKIEERELRNKERVKLSWFIFNPDKEEKNAPEWWNIKKITMDEHNIPTKLITLTYNNETIESYE